MIKIPAVKTETTGRYVVKFAFLFFRRKERKKEKNQTQNDL